MEYLRQVRRAAGRADLPASRSQIDPLPHLRQRESRLTAGFAAQRQEVRQALMARSPQP